MKCNVENLQEPWLSLKSSQYVKLDEDDPQLASVLRCLVEEKVGPLQKFWHYPPFQIF